jgi:hypothetical protein
MKFQSLAQPRPLRRHGLGMIAAAILTVASGHASATGYPIGTPTPVPAGYSCQDFDTANILEELSIAPLPDGPYGHNDGTLDLSTVYYQSTEGWVLDWYQNSTGQSIHHVVIQGQEDGYAYSYDPPVTSDRNLHGDLVDLGPLVKPQYESLRSATFCYSLPSNQFDGCTLGYWKVRQHHDSWPAGFATWSNQRIHFGAGAFDDSLLNALDYKGGSGIDGGKRILLKQAVAALLNSASNGVNYPLSQIQVREYVVFALGSNDRDVMLALAGTLDAYNNQGCPLN